MLYFDQASRMLALIIAGAIVAGLVICISSDPEYVQYIKDAINWLVKAGYDSEKIVQTMHFYVNQ